MCTQRPARLRMAGSRTRWVVSEVPQPSSFDRGRAWHTIGTMLHNAALRHYSCKVAQRCATLSSSFPHVFLHSCTLAATLRKAALQYPRHYAYIILRELFSP
jgi:hypothetical protein